MIERRAFLGLGLGAAAALVLPDESPAKTRKTARARNVHTRTAHARIGGPRRLAFKHLHTGESLDAVYWEDGAYVPEAVTAINTLLRDFRTEEVHVIDPALLNLLSDLRRYTGTVEPYRVVSAFRSQQTNDQLRDKSAETKAGAPEVAKKSLHVQGMAIDLRLPDVALTRLRRAAKALNRGGVGYYPDSDFIHVDVGPVRYWQGT